MAKFRVETVLDKKSQKYSMELYYPDNAQKPFAVTKPIYFSPETALQDCVDMMEKSFKKPIKGK